MLEALRQAAERDCGLRLEQPILVGVSGGPDSLCLLHALHSLGYQLVAAHLDHQLRPESAQEAEHVRRWAESLGVPFHLESRDVAAYAEAQAASLEEAARTLRYGFLFRLAAELGAQAVAVGHNADDQVETVLMHLLRGAGLSGLKAMQPRSLNPSWSDTIPLVRPLLSLWREQIVEYCQAQQLDPVFDRSNLDTTYFRNRLRHELIPHLESYNPQIEAVLRRTAQALAGDHQLLEAVVDEAWEECVCDSGEGWVALEREPFLALLPGAQRRLMRRAMAALRPGLRDIDFQAVERALGFVASPPKSHCQDLIARMALRMEGERVFLATWEADLPTQDWPQLPAEAQLALEVPGEVALAEGWRLHARRVDDLDAERDVALENPDPCQVWLDAAQLELPLTLRRWVPGERFHPLGMEGKSVKLADFFISVKLPRRARPGWPVLFSGEQVVWVAGYRLDHTFRLTEATEHSIKLTLTHSPLA